MPGTITSSRPAIASASCASTGAGDVEDLGQRAVAQLEHVAEQHQPVGALELSEEPLEEALAAEQVGAAAEAQVQIRDHRRAHRRIVAGRRFRQLTTQVGLAFGPWAGKASARPLAIRCARAA